jgi:hypothetical protein
VTINEGVEKIGYAFYENKTPISAVTIPSSVKQLDWGAFNGWGLKEVAVLGNPSGITQLITYSSLGHSITRVYGLKGSDAQQATLKKGITFVAVTPTFYLPPTGTNPTAAPTASSVLVNGSSVPFQAYTIGGNNYFKLRDLAMVLNGTSKQFSVGWDGVNNAISMTSGTAYTPVGEELSVPGTKGSVTATLSTSVVYLNGNPVVLTAYTIAGNNYFKLRDVGSALNFGVTWDGNANMIKIDSSTGYTE